MALCRCTIRGFDPLSPQFTEKAIDLAWTGFDGRGHGEHHGENRAANHTNHACDVIPQFPFTWQVSLDRRSEPDPTERGSGQDQVDQPAGDPGRINKRFAF